MHMATSLSTRTRIGKMLVGAAVIVPALAVAAMIVMSHLLLVHYERRDLIVWLVLDAAVMGLGLVLIGEEGL